MIGVRFSSPWRGTFCSLLLFDLTLEELSVLQCDEQWRDWIISWSSDEGRSSFSCHIFNNSDHQVVEHVSVCAVICISQLFQHVLRCWDVSGGQQREDITKIKQIWTFLEWIYWSILLSALLLADWIVTGGTVFMIMGPFKCDVGVGFLLVLRFPPSVHTLHDDC